MAEAIAIIQISDRIIGLCKYYIGALKDAPSELRKILVEISTLRSILENLEFLKTCDSGTSSTWSSLDGTDGAFDACYRSLEELQKLIPLHDDYGLGQNRAKRQRVHDAWTTLAWPFKETKARKLLDEVQHHKATFMLAITADTAQDIKEIKSKVSRTHEILTENQRQDVIGWLHHTNPSDLHHRNQRLYEPGTGNWMFRTPEWKEWLEARLRCIWIHGIPGAGKTVLMSHLIEQLRAHCDTSPAKCGFAYYYCYFGHEQDESAPFLRWLLTQVCRQSDQIPTSIYKTYKLGEEPDLPILLRAIEESLVNFESVYVVVDALDESCLRQEMLKVCRDFATDSRFEKIKLLVSSREYLDIETIMKPVAASISMNNEFVTEDIRIYVRSMLRSNRRLSGWPADLLKDIEAALTEGARGMFRWAVCQIDVIQRLKGDREYIEEALTNLPDTLHETYDRVLANVMKEDQMFVHHALEWISLHNELYRGGGIPLSILLQEVEYSLSRQSSARQERFYDHETLRECCGCLIDISTEHLMTVFDQKQLDVDSAEGREVLTARYAHYTVREYLDSNYRSKSFNPCSALCKHSLKLCHVEAILAENIDSCANESAEPEVLSCDESWIDVALQRDFNSYCLLSAFRCLNWLLTEICQHEALRKLVICLLNPLKPHFRSFKTGSNRIESGSFSLSSDHQWDFEASFHNVYWDVIPLGTEAATFLNLYLIANYDANALPLLEEFVRVRAIKPLFDTRLEFSKNCWGPDGEVEEFKFDGCLIEVAALLSTPPYEAYTFLLGLIDDFNVTKTLLYIVISCDEALASQSEGLVERLLQLGADVNSAEYPLTPLQAAVSKGKPTFVRSFLQAGARPNKLGNVQGPLWKHNTLMSFFNQFHNLSCLRIIRKRRSACWYDLEDANKVEDLLLQHGAQDFEYHTGLPDAQDARQEIVTSNDSRQSWINTILRGN